jgi:DNA-binding transcriptional ArsR family regulator
VRFSLEPVRSALQSLLLITRRSNLPGVTDWVMHTAQAMTRTEQRTNTLVMLGFHYAVTPVESWNSFPAYIEYLALLPPEALGNKMLDQYDHMPPCDEVADPTQPLMDRQTALQSADNYLTYLRQRFSAENVDEELERQAYQYLTNPPTLQRLIIDHLTSMWQKYLSKEWERRQPMLQEAVHAFQQLDLQRKSLIEAARLVTNQDLPEEKWAGVFDRVRRVVFVPHPHIGPYLLKMFAREDEVILFFGARLPKGSAVDVPDLSRTEIAVRLSALADDTRLQILRYIAEHGEQRSQEIMDALDLSQSAASRHLTQLSATGYLKERRCDGAKCYALDPERITDTMQAISQFLLISERNQI